MEKWFLASKQFWAYALGVLPIVAPIVKGWTGIDFTPAVVDQLSVAGVSLIDAVAGLAAAGLGAWSLIERIVVPTGLDKLTVAPPKS